MGQLTDIAHAGERWTNDSRLKELEGRILASVFLDNNLEFPKRQVIIIDDPFTLKLS